MNVLIVQITNKLRFRLIWVVSFCDFFVQKKWKKLFFPKTQKLPP